MSFLPRKILLSAVSMYSRCSFTSDSYVHQLTINFSWLSFFFHLSHPESDRSQKSDIADDRAYSLPEQIEAKEDVSFPSYHLSHTDIVPSSTRLQEDFFWAATLLNFWRQCESLRMLSATRSWFAFCAHVGAPETSRVDQNKLARICYFRRSWDRENQYVLSTSSWTLHWNT